MSHGRIELTSIEASLVPEHYANFGHKQSRLILFELDNSKMEKGSRPIKIRTFQRMYLWPIWTGVVWTLHWHNIGDTWEILSHYLGLDMVATWGRPTRYSAYGQSLDRFSDKVRQQTHIQWKCKRTFVIFVQDFLKKHFCSGAVDVYFPSVGFADW